MNIYMISQHKHFSKLPLISFLIFMFSGHLLSQTPVSGILNGATWIKSNSPYLVTGNITVLDLSIAPGVQILFGGNFDFNVTGHLSAIGTNQDSITFRPDLNNQAGWKGLYFGPGSSTSELVYCQVDGTNNFGVRFENPVARFEDCTVTNSMSSGIEIAGTEVNIHHCVITANADHGVSITNRGSGIFSNCIINNNTNNGIYADTGKIVIGNSLIHNNSQGGIFLLSAADTLTMTNCNVVYNTSVPGIFSFGGVLNIKNSIVYFNGSGISGGSQNIIYSDVQGGSANNNNINADPQFEETHLFRLSSASPCIDHGDTSTVFNDLCFPPSLGSERNDMGMYGGPGACGWYESLYVSPSELDFGNITLGDTVGLPVIIKNYSSSPLSLTLLQVSGTDASSFDLVPNTPFDILPYDSVFIRTRFFPNQVRSYYANLTISTGQELQLVSLAGTGVIPDIFVTPISLDFKEVEVGDSSSASVRIFNVGQGELRISTLSSSDTAFSTRFHPFPVIIPPALVDTFQVQFKPDTTLSRNEQITIYTNDPDESSFTVSVKGTGLAPILTINQDSLDLGTVNVYHDLTAPVIFTNAGNDTLHIFSFEISGPESLAFSINNNPGELFLAPSAADTISIRFFPSEVGLHAALLKIESNDPFNNPQSVTLQGWGVKPELILSSDSLNFGQVQVASDSLLCITITNNGTAILEVTEIQILPDTSVFTVVTGGTGFSLPPVGAADSIKVSFAPLTAGPFSALLQMISNDPDHDTVQVHLSGRGVNFEIAVSPDDSLDFGKVPVHADSILIISFENRGSGDLSVELKLIGPDSAQFRCGSGDSSFTIPSTGPVRGVEVIFNPESRGTKTAYLQIFSNDTNNPSIILNLTGTGQAAELLTDYNPVQFDSVYVWEKQIQSLHLYNHGDLDLVIDSLRIMGHDSSDFLLLCGTLPFIIPVGYDSQEIQIQFFPLNPGEKNVHLQIFSNDPGSPSEVGLNGKGLLDLTPAEISIDTLLLNFTIGSSTPFQVILKDDESVIQSAYLYSRPGGKKTFSQTLLEKTNDSLWTAVIQSGQITERGLEYYVQANHGGAVTIYPLEGTTRPKIGVVQIPELILPQSTLNGKYQMISLPVQSGDQSLSELFQDELGLYDSTQYRLFDWDTDSSRYTELSGMDRPLPPSTAFWLITRKSKSLQIENARSSLSDSAFPVILKQGWNMIAVPFAFPVSWEDVDATGIQGKKLWSYSGDSWEIDSVMIPFHGYAVNAFTDTVLHIPVLEADTTALPKPVQPKEWYVQIMVRKGNCRDFYNFAGTCLEAKDEWDRYDISEPPVIGNFVSLYFIPSESDSYSTRLAGDFRPPDQEIYTYNLKLISNFSGSTTISFLPKNIPDPYDWVILSTQGNIRYPKDLLTTDSIEESFRMIVGTKAALEPVLQEYREIPRGFNLAQNFPNPFNPETTIEYQLPEATWLRIEIFDILGRKIRSLLPYTRQAPGYYELTWDGQNDHRDAAASAVYILVLRSANYQKAIKMVLQR